MGCRTLIGATEPGGAYTARWLQWGDQPDQLIPVLRRIWRDTFTGDTAALAAALLARDWSTLDPQPSSDAFPALVVAGVGHETRGGSGGLRRGRLAEAVTADLEWLYLVDVATDTVVVYEATRHNRWLRHSVQFLDPVEELFVTEPGTAGDGTEMTVCTVCGAVDEITYQELPSMAGSGHDTCTACIRCGSSITTDPMFGAHVDRKPWPPATTPQTSQ
jgi:hypothetical protein